MVVDHDELPCLDVSRRHVFDGFVELLQEALENGDVGADRLGSVIADHQRLAHGSSYCYIK